ncbi:hypothetical protein [Streptomyces achromogenes]|uniref:hypothetical protein n=1 Tax=Streptomyces achromogenes TaxID=67255 RepID=UPI0036CFEE2C
MRKTHVLTSPTTRRHQPRVVGGARGVVTEDRGRWRAGVRSAGFGYAGQYGPADQGERTRLGDTYFQNGLRGLSAKPTGGVGRGFNREPGGTWNSMTTGGKSYHYLTDAIGSVIGLVDVDGNEVDTCTHSPRGARVPARSGGPVAQPYRFTGAAQGDTGW